jgi:hypothetical protein
MLRITDAVEQILLEDSFVVEAMQRGILNVSAYAKEIHKAVEMKTMKPVKHGTIVVALSRISATTNQQDFNPHVVIDNFNVTSSITEITFERTKASIDKLSGLNNVLVNSGEFFTVTEGLHEITLLCTEKVKNHVTDHFAIEPKVVINDLVAISVRFSVEYMHTPNTIYSLIGALAVRNINVIEIVSTYTELTFIIYKNEMEKTIQSLNTYSEKGLVT